MKLGSQQVSKAHPGAGVHCGAVPGSWQVVEWGRRGTTCLGPQRKQKLRWLRGQRTPRLMARILGKKVLQVAQARSGCPPRATVHTGTQICPSPPAQSALLQAHSRVMCPTCDFCLLRLHQLAHHGQDVLATLPMKHSSWPHYCKFLS